MRDPLLCAYQALSAAISHLHGSDFPVRDGEPNPTEFKKVLPAAHILLISGTAEKALMREYEPHGLIDNGDGTFTVGTESVRFDYLIQVSFFADKPGRSQRLSNEFLAFIETQNEIPVPEDKWGEVLQIFLTAAPLPPRGKPDLYQCDATYRCSGKLITEDTVSKIDMTNLKFKITS
ncbi:hypothetical protein [Bacillus sp. 3255]|uniref:hypothetical protein n=1 Tax=Bacillus sp. 3255 TaxID=2817904 RepID=UPI002859F3AE|nr:hypothetical protein [Bacillus sp. 3255]MDR6883024.1 hypothetical protein [Bacillus sp. 3255]